MTDFKYKPDGEVLKKFMKNDTFFRGIRGPVGSGRSCSSRLSPRRNSRRSPRSPRPTLRGGPGDLRQRCCRLVRLAASRDNRDMLAPAKSSRRTSAFGPEEDDRRDFLDLCLLQAASWSSAVGSRAVSDLELPRSSQGGRASANQRPKPKPKRPTPPPFWLLDSDQSYNQSAPK